MIRAALVVAVLTLSSCASYSEMQAKEPRLELTTTKTVAEFAGCVMPVARDLWRSMATIAPDGDSQVISVATENATLATTTISPGATGSKVAVRATAGFNRNEWADALRQCQ